MFISAIWVASCLKASRLTIKCVSTAMVATFTCSQQAAKDVSMPGPIVAELPNGSYIP